MFSLKMNALLEEKPPERSIIFNLIYVNFTKTLILLLRLQDNTGITLRTLITAKQCRCRTIHGMDNFASSIMLRIGSLYWFFEEK